MKSLDTYLRDVIAISNRLACGNVTWRHGVRSDFLIEWRYFKSLLFWVFPDLFDVITKINGVLPSFYRIILLRTVVNLSFALVGQSSNLSTIITFFYYSNITYYYLCSKWSTTVLMNWNPAVFVEVPVKYPWLVNTMLTIC